jgi:hypothetical protein
MGEKLLESNIKVPNIEIEVDENSEKNVERVLNEFGRNIPIISINDYVISLGDLVSLEINVAFNSFLGLPTFTFTVNDSDLQIRKALKRAIDTCIIYISFQNWPIKCRGLILNTLSDIGDPLVTLSGIVYFEKLYTVEQKIYNKTTVKNILKDVCKSSDIGLFVFDNKYLNLPIGKKINPHIKRIEFIDELIKTKTRNNIYCYDVFGYLHIGNIPEMRKSPLSQYTLRPYTGEQVPPKDMIFTSIRRNDDHIETFTEDFKIPISYYGITTNISELIVTTQKDLAVIFEDGKQDLESNALDIDLQYDDMQNMFSGFTDYNYPFYADMVNKTLKGNLISLEMNNIMFELSPFDNVMLELYLHESQDKPQRLDEEHSGPHIVLSYSITYDRSNKFFNGLKQIISLI